MIAPTHVAFALTIGNFFGVEGIALKLMLIGSVLPDIDHPQSFIGKCLNPFSIPINRKFGHRQFVHSLLLWGILTVLGYFLWKPLMWFSIGGVTHCLLDCWNLQGVQLLHPLFRQTFVLMSRNYRLKTGDRGDFILMFCLWLTAWGAWEIKCVGGIRQTLSYLTGSYQIAKEAYKSSGNRVCYMNGFLRYPNSSLVKGRYKIIGTEGSQGNIAIWDHVQNKILHLPSDAEFVACWLEKTDECWNLVSLKGGQKCTIRNGIAFKSPNQHAETMHYWEVIKEDETVSDSYLIYESGILELSNPAGNLLFIIKD